MARDRSALRRSFPDPDQVRRVRDVGDCHEQASARRERVAQQEHGRAARCASPGACGRSDAGNAPTVAALEAYRRATIAPDEARIGKTTSVRLQEPTSPTGHAGCSAYCGTYRLVTPGHRGHPSIRPGHRRISSEHASNARPRRWLPRLKCQVAPRCRQVAVTRGARLAGTLPDSTSQRTVSAMVWRKGTGRIRSSCLAAESSNRVSRRRISTPSRSAG